MKQHSARRQAGDTIVEVLIAISIVAVVLVGAFYVSNTSSKTVQDNLEHTQAQQELQSQLEALRSYVQTTDSPTFVAGQDCMGDDNQPHIYTDCPAITVGGATGVQPYFTKNGDTYTFAIQWDSIQGGQAQEQFVYRVYPHT